MKQHNELGLVNEQACFFCDPAMFSLVLDIQTLLRGDGTRPSLILGGTRNPVNIAV